MKSAVFKFFLAFLTGSFLILTQPVFASHIPPPTGYVNDFAGVLSSQDKSVLENNLKDYEQKTTNEISVVIIKSLNGDSIEDFSIKTFEEWKIGKKGKDNGILFIASIDDRKMRIEIGYGAEPYLTDGQAGEIIRNIIAPKFKRQDYYGGISDGVEEIKNHLSQSPVDKTKSNIKLSVWSTISQLYERFGDLLIYAVVFIFYFPVSYLGSFIARSKSIWLGSILGSILGLAAGLVISTFLIAVISALIGAFFGGVLDFYVSSNYQKRKKAGLSTSWWSSGGGFDNTGGGFGGFGGGGGGGGGASGGW